MEFVRSYWGNVVTPGANARALQIITLASHRTDLTRAVSITPDEIDTLPPPHPTPNLFRPTALIRVGWLGLFSLSNKPHPRNSRPWPTLTAHRYDDNERGPLPTDKPLSQNPDDHLPLNGAELDMRLLHRCVENFTRTHSSRDHTLGPWVHADVRMAQDPSTNTLYPYVTHAAAPEQGLFTSVVLPAHVQPGLA